MKEREKQLALKEKIQKEAETALASAWRRRHAAREAIRAAEESLARLRASQREGADSESWSFRRKWKQAEEALSSAMQEDEAAAAEVTTAQKQHDEASDAVLELKAELVGPRVERLRGQAAALVEELRGHQAAAFEAAKKLVSLYVGAREAVPPRVVMRRAVDHYLVVCPRDPAMKEMIGERLGIKGIPKGYFSLEYFKALAESGPGGRYELWEGPDGKGQDLTPPEKIETVLGDPRLPEELEAIRKLDLGVPLSNGSKPEGKPSRGRSAAAPPKRITFFTLSAELEQQAAGRKA